VVDDGVDALSGSWAAGVLGEDSGEGAASAVTSGSTISVVPAGSVAA
jgi:hypothetical protein